MKKILSSLAVVFALVAVLGVSISTAPREEREPRGAYASMAQTLDVASSAYLAACKGPVTPQQEQFILSSEQTICVGIAVIAGANTPAEIKGLCPMLPPLTEEVIAAINALIPIANQLVAAMPPDGIGGAKAKLATMRAKSPIAKDGGL